MIIKVGDNLELRQVQYTDSDDIFNTIDTEREYLQKWLPFVEYTQKLEDTQDYLKSVIEAPEQQFEYIFTIRKDNKFAGLIGFKCTDRLNKKTEIGYWLSEKSQGQGLVTKSVEKLCNFAFEELDINRIQIKCAVGNKSSINIPRKLGFYFEGIERDGELLTGNIFADLEIYSKLRDR